MVSSNTVDEYKEQLLTEPYPLHRAAREGNIAAVQYLLSQGHIVNATDHDRVTPLHEACLAGQLETAQFLIENDALVNATNIDAATALCDACAGGHPEVVKMLLEHGALVNPPLVMSSPLHEAAIRGYTKCARLLVEAGAKLDAMDCHFGTPLHASCVRQQPNIACVQLLLSAGAKVNATKIHKTALHYAVLSNDVNLVHALMAYGANCYMQDNQGKKPKDLTVNGSSMYKVIDVYEKTPRNLVQICRLAIRKAIGPRNAKNIAKLKIPERIVNYLMFKHY